MKALTLQIQVKTVDIPNPMPFIKAAAVRTARLIMAAINGLLIALGILAVGMVVLMIIDPNMVGVIVSEGLHQMYVWATS